MTPYPVRTRPRSTRDKKHDPYAAFDSQAGRLGGRTGAVPPGITPLLLPRRSSPLRRRRNLLDQFVRLPRPLPQLEGVIQVSQRRAGLESKGGAVDADGLV